MAWGDIGLLAVELLIYSTGMLLLFRLRRRMGLGLFFTALGSLHFLETYLAASLYVQILPGMTLSPGSVILFSGKFFFILLLYIREDALVARQPIYGLLFGNVLTACLVVVLSRHVVVAASGSAVDVHLLDQLGALMLWGSALLFVDCLLVILLYERLSRIAWLTLPLRLWLAAVAVLVFDQIGFFTVLHLVYDAPWSAGWGGLVGKVMAAACYALLLSAYLRWLDRDEDADGDAENPRLRDVFQALTYRQRYEALRTQAEVDALTGLPHRGMLDVTGERLLTAARERGTALTALMIDIDHFKRLNDGAGHQAGDEALRHVADVLRGALRDDDCIFRYGGDEFVVLLPDTGESVALALAERLRAAIRTAPPQAIGQLDLSIGLATASRVLRNTTLPLLLAEADRQLYVAKASGRGCVRGSVLRNVTP